MMERQDKIDQNISIVQVRNNIVIIYVFQTIFTGINSFIPINSTDMAIRYWYVPEENDSQTQ